MPLPALRGHLSQCKVENLSQENEAEREQVPILKEHHGTTISDLMSNLVEMMKEIFATMMAGGAKCLASRQEEAGSCAAKEILPGQRPLVAVGSHNGK